MNIANFTIPSLLTIALAFSSCKKDSGGSSTPSGDDTVVTEEIANETAAGQIDIGAAVSSSSTTSTTSSSSSSSTTSSGITTLTAENMTVPDSNAGALQLPGAVDLVPNSNASASLTSTDFDNAEQSFTWSPAKEPLKLADQVLCMFSLLGSNKNINDGPYLAQAKFVKKCLTDASQMGGGMGTGGGDATQQKAARAKNKDYSATVVATKPTNKALVVDAYLTVPFSSVSAFGPIDQLASGGTPPQEDANIYISATVAEAPSVENPFGVFDIFYQAFKVIDGAEESRSFWEGFLEISKQASADRVSDVNLKFHQTTSMSDYTGGWETKILHRAAATLTPSEAGASENIKKSLARTATDYSWAYLLDDDPTGSASGSDESGSFSLAFYGPEKRALTKWVQKAGVGNEFWKSDQGFDPKAPVCKSTEEFLPNVYQTGIFDLSGNRIHHKTSWTFDTGKTDSWGWPIIGWMDAWGFWINGVSDGDALTLYDASTQQNIAHTYHELKGVLKTENWQQIAPNQNLSFICPATSSCLKYDITDTGDAYANDVDFTVTDGNNDMLQFNYNGEGVLNIDLDAGTYSASSLATHIDDKINTAMSYPSLDPITVSFNAQDGVFEFESDANTFDLLWSEGATTAESLLGFSNGSDDTGVYFASSDTLLGTVYTYDASLRELKDGSGNSINVASTILDSYLSFNLILTNNGGDTRYTAGDGFIWSINRYSWSGMNLNHADGSWFDTYSLIDYDDTSNKFPEITFSCNGSCPKSNITQSLIDGDDTTSVGTNYYYYKDWILYNYGTNGTKEDGQGDDEEIKLSSDVKNANLTFTDLVMTNGNRAGDSVKVVLFAQSNVDGGVKKDGNWVYTPEPIAFQDRTVTSNDIYPGFDGSNALGKGLLSLTYDNNLTLDSWGMCCFDWAATDNLDQWGGYIWAPKMVFKNGAELTVANTTGSVTSGQSVKVSSLWTELIPKSKDDCSSEMQAEVDSLPSKMNLPGPASETKQNVKANRPAWPKVDGSNQPLTVRVLNGNCIASNSDGSCK